MSSFDSFKAAAICCVAVVLALGSTPEAAAARKAAEPATARAVQSVKPKAQAAAAERAERRKGRVVAEAPAPRAARTMAARAGRPAFARAAEPARITSIGAAIGLRLVDDPLDLRSSVALVVDQQSGEALFEKNATAVLPIASITKLMTAMVVLDAQQSLSEVIEITAEDIDTEKFSRSRLKPGTRLSRAELLNLALMASENRAAHALGRSYPGGVAAYAAAANAKARSIGMADSYFVEPTGLSSRNVSTAQDLARMVNAASDYPLIRQYSTAQELAIDGGRRDVVFRNTNRLIDSPSWEIGLQKTGFINEAGNCLVMQTRVDGRPMIMVLLDADGRQSRFADAQRLKHWLERGSTVRAAMRGRPVIRAVTYHRS